MAAVLAAPPPAASPSLQTAQRRSAPVARSAGGSTSSLVSMPAVKLSEQLKEMEELRPLPRNVEGVADDPSVHNPLQRHERLGTGWFGVIMEHDGVLFQDTWELHTQVRAGLTASVGLVHAPCSATHACMRRSNAGPPHVPLPCPVAALQAWLRVSQELGHARPLGHLFRRYGRGAACACSMASGVQRAWLRLRKQGVL